ILALENHRLMDKIDSPTHDGQKCYVVNIDNYAYIVPYVDDSKVCFLKTIYPSRKHTKFYNLKG
ncbi:MAG: toxin, partial [Campylobacterota bacterium]|nr:toxin [Campylobacterota bacterium]